MRDSTKGALEESGAFGFIYGVAPAMQVLNAVVGDLARSSIPVLISGESGTGKDTYARLLHRLSQSGEVRFHKINCAAIDSGRLLTIIQGLSRDCSDQAARSSVYLDSVQDLDLPCQRVLLAYFAEEEEPARSIGTAARVISSTTSELETEVEKGRFRSELFFRLNGARLRLPPLRERKDDIPILMEHFLTNRAVNGKSQRSLLDSRMIETLLAYSWPGNIRELENLAVKITAFGDVKFALSDLLVARIQGQDRPNGETPASLKAASRSASRQAERKLIVQALERTHWNRKQAAQELQISYKSLLYKIKQIDGLDRK